MGYIIAESSESNSDMTSEKADFHHDEIEFENNSNSKQNKKNNKSHSMIKKPVWKFQNKMQVIKNASLYFVSVLDIIN